LDSPDVTVKITPHDDLVPKRIFRGLSANLTCSTTSIKRLKYTTLNCTLNDLMKKDVSSKMTKGLSTPDQVTSGRYLRVLLKGTDPQRS
jgi:hypothetical protein